MADAHTVFDALTTATGLTAWWASATGDGDQGGELQLTMHAPEPLVLRVDEAVRPTRVGWTVVDCAFLPDWVGTRPVFDVVTLGDGACEVHLRHHGLTSRLECMDMCARGWDHFTGSLRAHAETGHGSPVGSPGDLARRRTAGREARS